MRSKYIITKNSDKNIQMAKCRLFVIAGIKLHTLIVLLCKDLLLVNITPIPLSSKLQDVLRFLLLCILTQLMSRCIAEVINPEKTKRLI